MGSDTERTCLTALVAAFQQVVLVPVESVHQPGVGKLAHNFVLNTSPLETLLAGG